MLMNHMRFGPDPPRHRLTHSVVARRERRTATELTSGVFQWTTRTWCDEYWGTELVSPGTGYCTRSRSAVRDDNEE